MTKAEFVQQGNAICRKRNAERGQAIAVASGQRKSEGAPSQAELEMLVTAALPPVREMIGELADLEAPKGDEDKVGAIVEKFERAADKVEADPTTVLDTSQDSFVEAGKLAAAYGLTDCSGL